MLKSFITQRQLSHSHRNVPGLLPGTLLKPRTIVRRLELVEQDAPASNFSHF